MSDNFLLNIAFFFAVVLIVMTNIFSFFASSWASGTSFFSQVESLHDYGLSITATPDQLKRIKIVEEHTKNKHYIVGGPDVWQYVVVLKKTPLATTFRYAKADLRETFRKENIKKEDIVFIEYLTSSVETSSNHSNWIKNYQDYFHAEAVNRITLSQTSNLVLFQ